jgi:hypothetical protein
LRSLYDVKKDEPTEKVRGSRGVPNNIVVLEHDAVRGVLYTDDTGAEALIVGYDLTEKRHLNNSGGILHRAARTLGWYYTGLIGGMQQA